MQASPKDEYPFKERRSGQDRRTRKTSPFSPKSLWGSRKHFRRKQDAQRQFLVDLYSPFFMVLLVFTLCLSLADAFLTMRLMENDFRELNPVMEFCLGFGPTFFILVKAGLTTLGLVTLLILKNYYLWRKFRTEVLLMVLPFLYLALVTYEVLMVVR